MSDTASELYNKLLETYFDEYNELSGAKINKMDPKYEPESLFLNTYNYEPRFENDTISTNKSWKQFIQTKK